MIKFFRHIRQNLLSEGKTRKYFKYAIGEIILVVIGILIALQINTWNLNSIDQQKELIYLRNIERDLNEQLVIISLQTEYEKSISNAATPIIDYYKTHQRFKIDSLFTSNIGYLTGRKTFVKNAPTYTELLSSGNIDIISNNALKDKIIKYYQELERIELIINKNNNLFVDAVFIPQMIGLSELQISGEFSNPGSNNPKANIELIDLNESKLKRITEDILEAPENELKLINSINFRNFISVIHLGLLPELKEKTTNLLKQIKGK